MRTTTTITALAVGAAVAFTPAVAQAADYPPAGKPRKNVKPKGKPKTFVVSKKKGSKYKTIEAAVKKAHAGDLIKVRPGTYNEGVKIEKSRYDGLRLIGDPKNPGKVVLNAGKAKGSLKQNGVQVNGANAVRVSGFTAKGYKANGFFFVNVQDYTADHLVAAGTGVYGVYAFNSTGGTIRDSEAYDNNDSGFYIGQTPPQAKPRRSIVTRVKSYRNVLGFSGTNMRYVTITKSKWFNNGTGIVPNALKSEKYAPPQENVIANNDVFWNNYNYYAGARFFVPKGERAGTTGYPIGAGVILFGSQGTTVEKNRIYGNWLSGFFEIKQILLAAEKSPALKEAAEVRNNVVRNNQFGLGGRDLNARDMSYDGTGSGNCFSGNTTFSPNVPADNSTFAGCPGPKANTYSPAGQGEMIKWNLSGNANKPDTWEQFFIRHPHVGQKGIKPLERLKVKKSSASAAASTTKKIKVGDNFFSPKSLTVKAGTTIKWSWSGENQETHDVKLKSGPKGVKKFHSDSAATDFSYKKKLSKKGTYSVLCTFHEGMTQKIKVK